MLHEETEKYESRLVAVANTRLLFNSLTELEEFLGNRAIRSNGMKRCFPTAAKMRAAYRDCKVEVHLQTDGLFDLDWLMRHYERAWEFYKARYARRKSPEAIAARILESYFASLSGKKLTAKSQALIDDIRSHNINAAILTLLLLKAIPGCDSKAGDITDIDAQFARVLQFLQDFTKGCGVFDVLPVIKLAQEEQRRTRLMLIFHTICILDTYEDFLNPVTLGQATSALKESNADLSLAGFWKEDAHGTFWEMEETLNEGVYFATRYCYESARLLSKTRFTLHLLKGEGNRLTAYFLHPIAMKHRLSGHPYGDEDNAWYLSDYPADRRPASLSLVRAMQSAHWPYEISLQRVDNPGQADRYAFEIQSYAKIDPYEKCRYTFSPSIYAITQQAVYVIDEQEECFYKLPRYTEHEFERLTLNDNVGILEIGPDGARQRYLAIDERLLYIPLTPRHLKRYGIEQTWEIE